MKLFIIIALIFIAIDLIYLFILIRPRAKKASNTSLLCEYAHRGLHGDGVPENSLCAFENACREGYGIELDVQLSRDGTVMVFHDTTLTRMTGVDKKVCELDADELTGLSLADTDCKIPTFRQVLALVDGRVPLLVELKGEDTNTSLCPKVAEILREYNGDFCIESFNPLLVREMKKHLPDAYYGQLYTNVCRDKKKKSALNIALTIMATNCLSRPDFIAYNKCDRHSLPVFLTTKLFRARKFVWTVKGDTELSEARKHGELAIFERV